MLIHMEAWSHGRWWTEAVCTGDAIREANPDDATVADAVSALAEGAAEALVDNGAGGRWRLTPAGEGERLPHSPMFRSPNNERG
jgi:hypothetical protein